MVEGLGRLAGAVQVGIEQAVDGRCGWGAVRAGHRYAVRRAVLHPPLGLGVRVKRGLGAVHSCTPRKCSSDFAELLPLMVQVVRGKAYPGWQPNLDSPVLQVGGSWQGQGRESLAGCEGGASGERRDAGCGCWGGYVITC